MSRLRRTLASSNLSRCVGSIGAPRTALALSSRATCALALLVACERAPQKTPPPPPANVGVLTVTTATLPQSFELVGQVQPSRRVEVRSRVEGIIVDRPFVEGATVTPGQLLFKLDRIKNEAGYQSAVARFDNATRALNRLTPLLVKHAVAQQDVDNAQTAVDAAKAAVDQAKKDLDDGDVRAEVAGKVGRARVELGARVTGPADLLTTIDRLDPVYVIFRPSSQQVLTWKSDPQSAPLLSPGGNLNVRVVLPNGSELPRVGKLTFVAPSLDSATGTQEFRATFDNADNLLVPGQFVNVRLSGFMKRNAIAVPQRAVQQGLGRPFVFVVGAGDTVAARDVKTGPWSGPLWIIDDGLKVGDRVVVDGVQKVAAGRVVKPSPMVESKP